MSDQPQAPSPLGDMVPKAQIIEGAFEAAAKAPWKSKTMWAAAIIALAPLWPPAGAFVAANPVLVSMGVSAIFAGLRAISHGKIGSES